MKLFFTAVFMSLATAASAQTSPAPHGPTQTPVSTTTAAPMSTRTTSIGALLAHPQARAIVEKHLPGFSANPQVQMGLRLTLVAAKPFSGGAITDPILAAIDADLAKLPTSQ